MSVVGSRSLTLTQLNRRITQQLAVPALRDVWVTAEISDFRQSGGHLYMELIEKDERSGATVARLRGIIWANSAPRVCAKFNAFTGRQLATGLKVMLCGSVNHHASYGLSFVITDIDPAYTLGDIERRRIEILRRLDEEGVASLNRELTWAVPALRVAVISAPGAAGYGDFMHQLFSNNSGIRFNVRLFPAVMQGENTAPSVIAALNAIASQLDEWDCVVIIRGGGSTSDLVSFDNYDLASNVAQFPLPVVVGIGHERDVTVLDYVANMRVKTPTAAAEWLISQAEAELEHVRSLAQSILRAATERLSGSHTQLAYLQGQLPVVATAAATAAATRLQRAAYSLDAIASRCIAPQKSRLDAFRQAIAVALSTITTRRRERLDSMQSLLEALSPVATMRRGYTISRVGGHAVTSASQLKSGMSLVTAFSDGEVTSTVE